MNPNKKISPGLRCQCDPAEIGSKDAAVSEEVKFDTLFERSKYDNCIIVGSEVREIIGAYRAAITRVQVLEESMKFTYEGYIETLKLLHKETNLAEAAENKLAELTAAPREEVGETERNYHFTDKQVMETLIGTDHLKDAVRDRLMYMTTGQKFSLYRAIAKLASKPEAK